MSSIEAEERHRFAERWTATFFAGVACLYGANRSGCSDSANLFPSAGAGVQYILKPAQGIVANLEFAVGKRTATGRCSSRWVRLVDNIYNAHSYSTVMGAWSEKRSAL
jgi:hypothetical protein